MASAVETTAAGWAPVERVGGVRVGATSGDGGQARLRLRHLPALDGLRGLAVIAVLLFHGGVGWVRGGFLGVDAFFVLSGFLIATLLLLELRSTERIDFRGFWSRRARRLLPAVLLLVAGAAAYAAYVAAPDTAASIRDDALATLGYVSNWRFVLTGHDYFAQAATPSPLLHTWSLAIEEQFYLVFPLALWLVARRRRPDRTLAIGAGVLALASAGLMAALFTPGADTSRVYYGTDTRAQSVLVGVALAGALSWAGVRRDRPGWLARAAGPVGLAVVLGLGAVLEGGSPALYRGGFLVFCLGMAAVLTHVVLVPHGLVTRSLRNRPLVGIGRISYGLYVWHWPIFLTLNHGRTGLEGPALLAARLGATLAAALVSYYAVELPVRRRAVLRRRWSVALGTPAAIAVSAAVVIAATVAVQPTPVSPAHAAPSTAAAKAAVAHRSAATGAVPVERPPVPPDRPVRVMLVGDSVGLTLYQGMNAVASRYGVELVDRTRLGCGIVRGGPYNYFGEDREQPPECENWPADWANDIATVDPDVVFVVTGRWEVMDRVYHGRWTRLGESGFDAYLIRELGRAATVLNRRGAHVVFATAPYYMRGERPDGGIWPEDEHWRVDTYNGLVRRVVDSHPGVALVDFGGHLSPGGTLARVIDGIQVRAGDGVHITLAGGRWLAPWLLPQLTALARPPGAAGGATPPPSGNPPG